MYPETDVKPSKITREKVKELTDILPDMPEVKLEKFQKHYEKEVIPTLRQLKGRMLAFLAVPEDSQNELISVTEWETEEAAQAYEHGGKFDELLASQREFFATLVDFKMEDDKKRRTKTATSDDIMVDKHKILIGKRF